MSTFSTEQEEFWAGEFGNQYISRNADDKLLAANINFMSNALRSAACPRTAIEFGANIGLNLKALKVLFPELAVSAVEINANAAEALRRFMPEENVHCESILEFLPSKKFDLVLIKGVLIHLNPDSLNQIYDKLYQATARYILVAEYYNPTPMALPYRGHSDRLFKRDFAGEILDRFSDLELRDYGFLYRRDPRHPMDDITWFLLEKNNA